MWGRSSAPAEVVEERVKLPVYVLGLASASFAFGGKYHRPGSTSVMPQISPAFGNCDVKMSQSLCYRLKRPGAEKVRSHSPEAQDTLPSWGCEGVLHCPTGASSAKPSPWQAPSCALNPKEKVLLTLAY